MIMIETLHIYLACKCMQLQLKTQILSDSDAVLLFGILLPATNMSRFALVLRPVA